MEREKKETQQREVKKKKKNRESNVLSTFHTRNWRTEDVENM